MSRKTNLLFIVLMFVLLVLIANAANEGKENAIARTLSLNDAKVAADLEVLKSVNSDINKSNGKAVTAGFGVSLQIIS